MPARALDRPAPSPTDMLRADHTRVLGVFHRYDAVKQALAESVCFALEVHAQLEEEVFYSAAPHRDAARDRSLDPGVRRDVHGPDARGNAPRGR